jgi:hypothetical protein
LGGVYVKELMEKDNWQRTALRRWRVSEPRYLMGDDYALNGVEGEEEIGDAGLPDRMWEDED